MRKSVYNTIPLKSMCIDDPDQLCRCIPDTSAVSSEKKQNPNLSLIFFFIDSTLRASEWPTRTASCAAPNGDPIRTLEPYNDVAICRPT